MALRTAGFISQRARGSDTALLSSLLHAAFLFRLSFSDTPSSSFDQEVNSFGSPWFILCPRLMGLENLRTLRILHRSYNWYPSGVLSHTDVASVRSGRWYNTSPIILLDGSRVRRSTSYGASPVGLLVANARKRSLTYAISSFVGSLDDDISNAHWYSPHPSGHSFRTSRSRRTRGSVHANTHRGYLHTTGMWPSLSSRLPGRWGSRGGSPRCLSLGRRFGSVRYPRLMGRPGASCSSWPSWRLVCDRRWYLRCVAYVYMLRA